MLGGSRSQRLVMRDLLLLVDYKGEFYSSTKSPLATMDLARIVERFGEKGCRVTVRHFSEVDFRGESYRNRFVLYQSSEDKDLLYKSYIEDVLLGLELAGARLIPPFKFFRAHNNKVFMEILRDLSGDQALMTIRSQTFGALEEFRGEAAAIDYPAVLKGASGALSTSVFLIENEADARKKAKRVSRSFNLHDFVRNVGKKVLLHPRRPKSLHRTKFLVQNLIPGMEGDWKVLCFGDKVWALRRSNREDDFRASGSGKFTWEEELPEGFLDFVDTIYRFFRVPYISIDVGHVDSCFHAIEMQFVMFGNLTLEGSSYYWAKRSGRWEKVDGPSVLEDELVDSVVGYMLSCDQGDW
jgi:glutathione synthase/RimK-type ligase-like ATP-grasp enzyme